MKQQFAVVFFIITILASCNYPVETELPQQSQGSGTETESIPETSQADEQHSLPTLQPFSPAQILGPDQFPTGYNPLTGQAVSDPELLNIPALLVSISHFPPIARPQAGFSYSPFVYEFFITEGSTRHLAAFYGEFPEPEIPIQGDCEIRSQPVELSRLILGNRVWHDENANGIQDPSERGIGGICIELYDINNNLLEKTSTDSNGYFAFNMDAGSYFIHFVKSNWFEFTQQNAGYEDQDSDADPSSGWSGPVEVRSTVYYIDAGLKLSESIFPPDNDVSEKPKAQVGPVRSGRLLYDHIGKYYQFSCLIYASADPDVLKHIPTCATVPHTAKDGGAMLEIERMMRIAYQNAEDRTSFNYTSNLYSDEIPEGGQPATELFEYWGLLNQSKWEYDSASESYWRYIDKSNPEQAGVFYNLVDRLNGRQVLFDNIVLLFVNHEVVTPTIIQMHMELGEAGKGYLFRNGQVFDLQWSTRAGEYERSTGKRRPIQFHSLEGLPIALKPGHTWVIIFDLQSYLEEISPSSWKARFIAPAGAK